MSAHRWPARALMIATLLSGAASASALERTSMRIDDEGHEAWAVGWTYTVAYYNICTGWVWLWSGWEPGARVGVAFDNPAGQVIDSSFMFFREVSPAGYGFTGTVEIHEADQNGCPAGLPFASQALLPLSGWNLVVWGGVWNREDPYVISYVFASDQGLPNPLAIGTDHPAHGPTGPQACGNCYPTTRTNHSFDYGTPASPLCPGEPFDDGVCYAELLIDATEIYYDYVVPESWAAVKNLYR